MIRKEALRIFRKEIECLSHTKCEDCILKKDCDPMITTPSDSEYIEAYSMAIKALEQEPRWIPVSEKLPEDHKDVLSYLSSDRISICRYNSHKLPFSNNPIGWGYVPGIGFIDFEKENVIAWMPLPQPFEPQESEDKE